MLRICNIKKESLDIEIEGKWYQLTGQIVLVSDPGEELKFVQMHGQGDVGFAGVGVGVFHHGAELAVVLHGREGSSQGVEGEEPFLPEHLAEGVRPVVFIAAGLDAQGVHALTELVQAVENGGELQVVPRHP